MTRNKKENSLEMNQVYQLFNMDAKSEPDIYVVIFSVTGCITTFLIITTSLENAKNKLLENISSLDWKQIDHTTFLKSDNEHQVLELWQDDEKIRRVGIYKVQVNKFLCTDNYNFYD